MTLRRLPDHIINQIAAGEVVAAPANAVKELVENALDAKASAIDITIHNGGMALVRVTDNGCGIAHDDLSLAVQPHTTSKMPTDRFDAITTMGFRGEALASIGAVSRMTVTSKHHQAQEAWALVLDAGSLQKTQPATLAEGTRINVENLFYPTPARLKFLKSPATETQSVVSCVQHLALSAPHVHFTLHTENKTILELAPAKDQALAQRVFSVLNTKDDILPIDFSANETSVKGFIGVPTLNRRTSDKLFFLVNNRCCKNRQLFTAARYAFGDLIPKGRFPVGVLWLSLPGEDVDVNAHPSKTDVRFRNPQHIRFLIEHAITEQLDKLAPHTNQALAYQALDSMNIIAPQKQRSYGPSFFAQKSTSFFQKPQHAPAHVRAHTPQTAVPSPAPPPQEPPSTPPLGFARCQLYKTYIVSEAPDALIITDQHAAHERIVYEDMKAQLVKGFSAQTLLAPIVIPLSPTEQDALQPMESLLEQWGFGLQKQQGKTVVTQAPAALKNSDVFKIIQDFFGEILSQGTSRAPQEALHALCSTTACHNSIRAGQILSLQEMNDLLRSIERTPEASQCNHGRPTHIRLSKSDMHKLFERT